MSTEPDLLSDSILIKLKEIALQERSVHSHDFVIRPQENPCCTAGGSPFVLIDPQSLFGRSDIRAADAGGNTSSGHFNILELGSGWGEFCEEWMRMHPDHHYIAMEIKADRIKSLLKKLDKLGTENVRILPVNFNWFLTGLFVPGSFDLIIINFPDPWPKKRHWKHRLIRPGFTEKAAYLLKPGGRIFMATDYGPYARKMISLFRRSPIFISEYDWPHYLRKRPGDFPPTRFETMQLSAGKKPYYMFWRLLSHVSENKEIRHRYPDPSESGNETNP